MNPIVIDTSVAIKWLADEPGTDQALALLRRIDFFYVPDFFLVEMDAVLTKKIRKRELEQQEASYLREEVRKLPFQLIAYENISEYAFDLAASLPVTLYDAMFLSVAIHNDSCMITADQRFYNGLQNTPLNDYIQLLSR